MHLRGLVDSCCESSSSVQNRALNQDSITFSAYLTSAQNTIYESRCCSAFSFVSLSLSCPHTDNSISPFTSLSKSSNILLVKKILSCDLKHTFSFLQRKMNKRVFWISFLKAAILYWGKESQKIVTIVYLRQNADARVVMPANLWQTGSYDR